MVILMHYDIIVVGGGFAGAAAAISAARQGAKVLLIEKSNCLGGAASVNLVMPFMKNRTVIDEVPYQLSGGLFNEILSELEVFNKTRYRISFHDEYLKLVLNRMAINAGVELLFNSLVTSAEKEQGKIKSITVCGKGNTYEFSADYFIDATGDANLIRMADFPFKLGREKDNLCQPMTLCFRVANVDFKKFDEEKPLINPLYEKYKEEGKIKNPRENVLIFKTMVDGLLHFNTTRIVRLDPTDLFQVTKAEIESREQVFEVFDFLKDNFSAFQNAELVTTAIEIGVRESRMIEGEYTLTGDEIKKCARFDDSIATGNYDIDIHNPEGSGTSHYFFPPGEYYEIPYRCLIPKNSENLLVAGRCVSCDHEAQASLRIMPIVCTLGQAAGVAAALAKEKALAVGDIDITALQKILTDNGAVLH